MLLYKDYKYSGRIYQFQEDNIKKQGNERKKKDFNCIILIVYIFNNIKHVIYS